MGRQQCWSSWGLCPPQVNSFLGRSCSSGPALKCQQAGSAAAGHCFPDDMHAPSPGALFICWTVPEPTFLMEQLFPALARLCCKSSSFQPSRPVSVCLEGWFVSLSFLRTGVKGRYPGLAPSSERLMQHLNCSPRAFCGEGVVGLECSAALFLLCLAAGQGQELRARHAAAGAASYPSAVQVRALRGKRTPAPT